MWYKFYGPLAQSGSERLPYKQHVLGSNPRGVIGLRSSVEVRAFA